MSISCENCGEDGLANAIISPRVLRISLRLLPSGCQEASRAPLSRCAPGAHIAAMASKSRRVGRGSQSKDKDGFSEAPQAGLAGAPVGPISAWADEITRGAQDEKPKRRVKGRGDPTLSDRSIPLDPAKEKYLKTARGTSIGGRATAKERAGAGLMPVAGLDVMLEDAGALPPSGVTATVEALSRLIEKGRPEFRDHTWVPHRPPRPEKSEGGVPLRIVSEFEPKGDQPGAIAELVQGISDAGEQTQVLLGVTGSGKTFTMAKVIEATQRPALILAPNKTLAAQLYGEFKSFFPENAVEYFVSYYDYYQPEAYVPRTDTYIEKESSINEQIDRMRHSATRTLLERDDAVIVASVSCIYGIGSVETYTAMTFGLEVGLAHRPPPGRRRPRGAAVQAPRHEFHARQFPPARRHAGAFPGAP